MGAHLTRFLLILALTLAATPALAQATGATTDGNPAQPVVARPALDPAAAAPTRQARPVAPAAAMPTAMQHGYFNVNGGYQGTTNAFTSAWSYPSNLETASVTARYSVKPGVLIDVAGGVRLWRDLSIGAAVSRYDRSDFASLSASVPHPFFYNQPRSLQATSPGPKRTETAVHLQAMWSFAAGSRIQLGVSGGPTFFTVRQTFISAVSFAEVYPYDTISISNTSTGTQSASKATFNVGGDLTCLIYKQIGVGGMVRFSGVTVGFKAADGSALLVKAGGLQVGAGLRVRF